MECPYCESKDIIKNGHAPSGKMRWKCNKCKKTFSKDSGKQYPPTSIPFKFIALILHKRKRKKDSLDKTTEYANIWLNAFKSRQVPICKKEQVSRSTVYKWIRQYGKIYAKLIPEQEAIAYLQHLLRQSFPPREIKEKEVLTEDYKIRIERIELSRMKTLKLIQDCMGREFSLELIRKYPEAFLKILNEFKIVENKQLIKVK